MPHVVLLGDSIFDNQAYVQRGEPDVVHQLSGRLPAGWQATLRAIDGSVLADVPSQVAHLPADASHLVVSAGGNDVLAHLGILDERATSVAHALARLAAIQDRFERAYRHMLATVLAPGLPTAVCTIYNGNFPSPDYQRLATLGAAIFNDTIIRVAAEQGIPVLELRLICADPADYANPIEPSARGGDHIASAITFLLATHDFSTHTAAVYAPPASGPSR